ncbi:MAG: hypothetical protein OXH72_16095 [Caldilineaceae bacterium]|nr:hypothetical protein [Caldilineaceae bacterium]MXZ23567.1 hypothetical protein [Caldilineaceae bacterium SB0665_bin_21]
MALETALRAEFLDLLERDAEFREAVRRQLLTAELIELPERFAAFAGRVDEFIVEQQAINASVEARFDRIDVRLQTITNDLGVLKGHAAGRAARDHVETILDELELTYVTILHRRDLVSLLAAAPDIAAGDRQSFYRADLVLEAKAVDGATRYVAVEASYTADRRDSDRARRNARFLTDRTGCPAHAVVASLRNDRDVQDLVDQGAVHWHQLTEKDLDPD